MMPASRRDVPLPLLRGAATLLFVDIDYAYLTHPVCHIVSFLMSSRRSRRCWRPHRASSPSTPANAAGPAALLLKIGWPAEDPAGVDGASAPDRGLHL